jgi:hypothetical protein
MAHNPFEPTIAGAQALPPYVCTGVRTFGFPLLADALPLQALCDQFLNIAPPTAGISFEPIPANPIFGPNACFVLVEALDYQSLKATTPPWDDLGEAPQQELLFAVPVLRKQGGIPVEAGIFMPYIFVENQGSALTGREVLGLPKLLGSFSLKRDFPQSGSITMRLVGRATLGEPIKANQLVKISSPLNALVPPSFGVRIGRFFGPLDVLFAGTAAFALIANAHTTGSMFGYSTRILIDPETPATDAYRSIMRCTYASTNNATGFLPPVNVTLAKLVDLDVQSSLGIRTTGGGKALSINPYFLDADFSLDGVTTLWHS